MKKARLNDDTNFISLFWHSVSTWSLAPRTTEICEQSSDFLHLLVANPPSLPVGDSLGGSYPGSLRLHVAMG